MPKTITTIWDPARHLTLEKDRVAYQAAAFEEGDSALFAAALSDIARANAMADARKSKEFGRVSKDVRGLSSQGQQSTDREM